MLVLICACAARVTLFEIHFTRCSSSVYLIVTEHFGICLLPRVHLMKLETVSHIFDYLALLNTHVFIYSQINGLLFCFRASILLVM